MHSFPLLKIFRRHPLKRNTLGISRIPNSKYRTLELKISHITINQPFTLQRAIAERVGWTRKEGGKDKKWTGLATGWGERDKGWGELAKRHGEQGGKG